MMAAMSRRALFSRRSLLCAFALSAAALAGCGKGGGGSVTKAPSAPTNRSPLAFTAEEGGLGYLALAPEVTEGAAEPYWLPHQDPAILLLGADDPSTAPAPPAAGTTVRAVPRLGAELALTVGGPAQVSYGCDGGMLEGISLAATAKPPAVAPAVPPGVLWILPVSPNAASWQPSGIEVAVRELSPERRVWKVGQLEVSLTRKGEDRALFAASAGQVWVISGEVERPKMDGAEGGAIDLTQDVPGMPSIAAAYSLTPPAGPTGPLLLVVATPTYEGVQLSALFYDGTMLAEAAALKRYLYLCAF